MRVLLAIACVVSISSAAAAQRPISKGAASTPAPRQTQGAPRPPAPQPLPQPRIAPPPILFPFGSLMPPPTGGLTPPTMFTPTDLTRPPRDIFLNRFRNPYRTNTYPGFAGSGYGGYGYPLGSMDANATATDAARAAAQAEPNGVLRLFATPSSAEVYVDAYYVGTVADIEAARGLTLPSGPHRLEIRAPDYQTATVDIRISPYEPVTYRATLDRVPVAPPVRPAPNAAKPMYLIPNCYLGNVPPRANRLPSGCDVKQVQVLAAPPTP
jgi:PEGA domain-containing protein